MAKAKAKFTINAIAPETKHAQGYEFELPHPDPEETGGTGMFFTVRGPKSPEVKAFMRGKINEQLRIEAKGNTPVATVEALEDSAVERAVAYTIGWRGIAYNEGEPDLEFTADNARTLYAEHEFIRSAVIREAETEGNYYKG